MVNPPKPGIFSKLYWWNKQDAKLAPRAALPPASDAVPLPTPPALPPPPSLCVLPSSVYDDFLTMFDRRDSVGMDCVVVCEAVRSIATA